MDLMSGTESHEYQQGGSLMGQAYTDSLLRKHAALDNEISQEAHRPHPDDLRMRHLKREKLKLKDAMSVQL
ncbi:YdcH family protein [Pacificimonas flava]|nr:YdcH family protein [Pacificimonas flava]